MKRSFIREILEHTNSDTISFAGGLPDAKLFPYKKLKNSAIKTFSNPKNLQYSTTSGLQSLKEEIAKIYTKKGFKTSAENILITSGSQQALDIICRFYQNSTITIEKPSYLGALNIFKLNNIKTKTIAIKKNGIDLKAFKSSIKATKLAYLIPDFQNPTSIQYSIKQREKIAKIIQKENAIIIEDAPYTELYFNKELISISSLSPQNSYHLGSFSKALSPALRLGWIRADKRQLEPLIAYKEAMDLHSSTISQHIALNYLQDGKNFNKHLLNLRANYKAKMEYFCKMLNKYLPEFKYTKPKGGMFIYGKFENIDALQLLKISMQNGVIFVPASNFEGAYNEIRFNFTNSSEKEIKEGLIRVAKSIASLQQTT